MKTLIVYKSVLGATKKYAHWLAQDLEADVMSFSEVDKETCKNYDVVIVASGTYAGKMPLVKFLETHWALLKHKKVIALGVGLAPEDDPQAKVAYEQIPLEIREHIKYFRVPGKMFFVKPMGEPRKENLTSVIGYVHGL